MGLRVTAAAAAIGVALFAASGASATTVITTYTGTVTSGGNTNFGTGNLAGDAFTAVFTTDISIPGEENPMKDFDEVTGGTEFGTLSPTSAVITLNGVSYVDSGVKDGQDEVGMGVASFADDGVLQADVGIQTAKMFPFAGLATPFTYNTMSGDDASFGFIQESVDDSQQLHLDVTSVTVGLAGPAPEPAAWALMLLGVFGIGGALRTRRALRPATA